MRDRLRAGVAVYNDGHYHAAHDAWEERWLDLESGTDDERLLHGLIQFTAAVHHARAGNWEGAVGLAESGREYLAELPATRRDLDLESIRAELAAIAADPEVLERRPPRRIEHEGTVPTLSDLGFGATVVAAPVLAEEFGFDEGAIAAACEYARGDLEAGEEESRFVALVFDFVREDDHRGIVARRLAAHVDRRRTREEDVEGLF